jgi:cytochrome c553
MKKNLLALSLSLALAVATSVLNAEETVSASSEGNSDAGKGKSSTCASCHGEDGNSMMPTFPKLAQQHASYLSKQLYAFKDGSRKDQVMASMAMTLNDADIADVSAYYAAQSISANPEPTLPPSDEDDADTAAGDDKPKETIQDVVNKGSNLYRNGDLTRAVSACIACHGPSGEGNKPAAFPSLRSQHPDYLIKTLNDFKSGTRSKNPDNMMYMIAKKMTEEEIKAVSYYISTMK